MTPLDWHPTDEDLTLHAYRDNTPEERAAVDRHLHECASCAAIAHEIEALQHLASAVDVPEPEAGFEDAVWARLAPALPHRAAWPPVRRPWSLRQVVAVTAWAAAVGGIVIAGYRWNSSGIVTPVRQPTAVATAPSQAQERVLLTALDAHFSQTEMLFVELMNAPDDAAGSLAFERATADDLVQSGRLYRATAAEAGHRRLTDVLDDVQTVLTEVALGPEKPGKQDLAAIRSRIEDDDLLFKVRAVTNDIRDRQQQPGTNEGAL
ncbi:MAG: zf-HC2 domain-containing protein [Acidobacteriota bacterium]